MALSDVALLRADTIAVPSAPETALARMFGSAELHRPARVALYWESYGVHPGDTVTVTLRVVPADPGLLARALAITGLRASANGIAVTWTAPDPTRGVFTIPGRVAALGQSLTLDVSQLEAGLYHLSITVTRPSGATASTTRAFAVVR